MTGFDTFVVVDWSARSKPSPARPAKDAIWIGIAQGGSVQCDYHRTRAAAAEALTGLFEAERQAGRRVLAGFDFPFAYPRGFAARVAGTDAPLSLWETLAARIDDAGDNTNNRFAVAADLNDLFPGTGPFWGCPDPLATDRLPSRGTQRTGHGLPERREPERRTRWAQPCWKLYTTGSVGSQALLGIPRLQALRERFGADLSVRPFQTDDTPIVLVELFPSLIADTVVDLTEAGEIRDRAQVRVLAQALSRLAPDRLNAMLGEGDPVEGWILGLGHETELDAAARGPMPPPPLRNDCFALPPGVNWTPVDQALGLLRDRLRPVTAVQSVPLFQARGRILASPVTARRSNPPQANTAVDGYGFAGPAPEGLNTLPLHPGRAAAGVAFSGHVPPGTALRVLTGAALPDGVDTVVLDEDVSLDPGRRIAFHGPLKRGANTRAAGEDVEAGDAILPAGRVLTPTDLALMAATGLAGAEVRAPLRVAVLSTGDEIVEPGFDALPGQIYDANRPMLLSLIDAFGHVPVDLGRVPDDRDTLRERLDQAAQSDAILTSGGASAGDEDHMSALLREAGAMQEWRIAVKPGRPLALGLWQGTPVFGLPGNPVAALVCALIFARPALARLAGADWADPQGFDVPAAFEKRKKPGRREYLRARIRNGRAEVFKSEGSGRISGLSWAEGLVELGEDAAHIRPGDPVRYLPFSGLGMG